MSHKKAALLYLDTGGGHRAAALAIREQMKKDYPETEVLLYNPLSQRDFLKTLIERGYGTLTDKARFFWPLIYNMSNFRVTRELIYQIADHLLKSQVSDFLIKEKITHVAVLHYLLNRPVSRAVSTKNIHASLYILDPFTVHPVWLHDQSLPVACFSDQAKRACLTAGYSADKVKQIPFIINPKFLRQLPINGINQFKRRHGFTVGKKLILIAGGGNGLKKGVVALKAALKSDDNVEIAVVCSRSVKFYREATMLVKNARADARVKIFGFVDFIYELMNAADIIIGKAGPAFVMEAALLRKPLLLVDYMYGQEKGNVQFVQREGLGFWANSHNEIHRRIKQILNGQTSIKQRYLSRGLLPCGARNSVIMLLGEL